MFNVKNRTKSNTNSWITLYNIKICQSANLLSPWSAQSVHLVTILFSSLDVCQHWHVDWQSLLVPSQLSKNYGSFLKQTWEHHLLISFSSSACWLIFRVKQIQTLFRISVQYLRIWMTKTSLKIQWTPNLFGIIIDRKSLIRQCPS